MNLGQRVAAALVAATALAAPASAPAARLVVPPCSVEVLGVRNVPVTGSGYTPGSFVRLLADGRPFGSAQADAQGRFAVVLFTPPFRSPRSTRQTFRVTADDGAGATAARRLRVTRFGARLPARAQPSSRVRMEVFGFAPGRAVYLHIRRGGRTRGTFRIGRAAAPCGTASRRLRYMPLERPPSGTYTYEFQQSKRYDRKQRTARIGITVVRPPRGR